MVEIMRNLLLFVFGLLLVTAPFWTYCLACPLALPSGSISINGHPLTVELAATPAARVCGLSQRSVVPQDQGMLFIFPDNRPRSFWMKDTVIPLSIAFIDDSGRILSIQHMVPLQVDKQYRSNDPVSYALEVNQGWFKNNGVEAGDVVKIKLPLVLDIR